MLDEYLDPADTFWTSLENKPLSRASGIFQKRRGLRSGLPDVQVIWRGKPIASAALRGHTTCLRTASRDVPPATPETAG